MSSQSAGTQSGRSLVRLPSNLIAYVAVLGALVSAAIHLYLAPSVIGVSQTTGILFFLNGLGWIGGVLVFFTRFWRRELYLVATVYALVTVVAFFVMSGDLSGLAPVSKAAEVIVAIAAAYCYLS